jgi:mono/diheme cytochrome c family protein
VHGCVHLIDALGCLGRIVTVILIAIGAATPSFAQADGHALVEEHCGSCHSIDSAGTSPVRLAPPLRRASEFYDLDQLVEMLQTGALFAPHPQMPLFKFDRTSARAMVNYLRSIQH